MDLVQFILAYFASKRLSLITAFLCWNPEEINRLAKLAGSTDIRLNWYTNASSAPGLPPRRMFREGIVLDMTCQQFVRVLERANSNRSFNHRYSWLILYNIPNNDAVLDVFPDAILPDADVVIAFADTLIDVYRVKVGEPIIRTHLGVARTQQDLKQIWKSLPTAVHRRHNLQNIYIKSAAVLSRPEYFKGWEDLRDRQIDTYPKLTYPLLMLLADDLNYRYNMKQVDLYGVINSNGTFNGLAGAFQRDEIEIGIASMFMRRDRLPLLHYCSETVGLKGAFIFHQPSQSAVTNVFVLPFSYGVWAASGAVFVGTTCLFAMLGVVVRRLALPDVVMARFTLAESFTFAIGTICQQGSAVSPQILSARVLSLFTLLTSLFAFTAYSAKIVSILQAPSDAIQTIDDLTQSPMLLGVQDSTYKKVYFAESTDPATQRLYQRKVQPQGDRAYLSVLEGMARVRTQLYAFQVEQSSGYDVISRTYTEREKCGLKEIQAFSLPMVAVPIRRLSGYRDLFAARLRWHREVGLMDRIRRIWMAARPQCAADSGGFVSVGILDVLPTLYVLMLGAAVALVLLMLEILLHAIDIYYCDKKFSLNVRK